MSKFRIALLTLLILVVSGLAFASKGAVAAPPAKTGVTFTKAGGATTTNATYTRIVELNLAAGKYLVVGRGTVNNQQALTDTVSCNIYSATGQQVDANTTTVRSGEYGALAFSGVATLTTSGVVWVECIAITQDPGPFTTARLTATSATDVISLP